MGMGMGVLLKPQLLSVRCMEGTKYMHHAHVLLRMTMRPCHVCMQLGLPCLHSYGWYAAESGLAITLLEHSCKLLAACSQHQLVALHLVAPRYKDNKV